MIKINKTILIGRLTADPTLRFLPGDGRAVAQFNLAVDKNLSKEKKQEFEQKGKHTADFIRIVVWGKQAENCANFLGKGRMIAVDGRLQTRSYENNEGQRIYITEVVAERVQFLDWGDKKENSNDNNSYSNDGFQPVDDMDSDIPF